MRCLRDEGKSPERLQLDRESDVSVEFHFFARSDGLNKLGHVVSPIGFPDNSNPLKSTREGVIEEYKSGLETKTNDWRSQRTNEPYRRGRSYSPEMGPVMALPLRSR